MSSLKFYQRTLLFYQLAFFSLALITRLVLLGLDVFPRTVELVIQSGARGL